MPAYTQEVYKKAIYDCWHKLWQYIANPKDEYTIYPDDDKTLNHVWELLKQHATEQEQNILKETHPILDELDECGINGYCGIGLGKYGGHAI